MPLPSAKIEDELADFAITIPVGPGHRPWLRATLRSLAIQDCKITVAVCAVDDTESLHAILAEFQDIISFVRAGDDKGQSAAINEGWTALNAHHYGWLNDDDVLHPHALTHALRAFEETQADVVHGRSDILEDGILRVGYGETEIGARLLRENPIAQPSTFIKRAALSNICEGHDLAPVDPNNHYAMDWDLWQRLYLSGAKFAATTEPLSITRWYTQTKTARPSLKKYRDYARVLKRGKSGPLRSLWTLVNFFIHNQAAYGRFPGLFKGIERILKRSGSSPQLDQNDTPAHALEVYHYQDTPMQVFEDDEPAVLIGQLKAGEILETTATRVSLSPVTNTRLI